MRPVRLTMQAFGPYAGRQVVDFRAAVAAGLFGIYGPTGSGKSSIFSAMTFALFGEAARAEQDTPSLRSDHADPDLRTEVEFVFDIGDRRYVALRRPDQARPRLRGTGETRDPAEAFLFDATGLSPEAIEQGNRGLILAEKKVGAVGAAVEALLGYGARQFRQIVLLPQGRFETFLAAKTRERLDILRDLFDVSLYRRLAARMKAEADEAERDLRDQRAVCQGRLVAEGFASTTALEDGIATACDTRDGLVAVETKATAAAMAARMALDGGRQVQMRFQAAEMAAATLAGLQARTAGIEALAAQVQAAEHARRLLDPEAAVSRAAGELAGATDLLTTRTQAVTETAGLAERAAQTLARETARIPQAEALRAEVADLERHKATLDLAQGARDRARAAMQARQVAQQALTQAQDHLTALTARRVAAAEKLRADRAAEGARQAIALRLQSLDAALKVAADHDSASRAVDDSRRTLLRLTDDKARAAAAAATARAVLEHAEARLAQVQAVHLAARLADGEPCPVCGALDHPAPASGRAEHAGLDAALREARAGLAAADTALRAADQGVAANAELLRDRQDRLAALAAPERPAPDLRADLAVDRDRLARLGPPVDLAAAEGALAELDEQVARAETRRDGRRDDLSHAAVKAADDGARLDQMLAAVPPALHDPAALQEMLVSKAGALAILTQALQAATTAETQAREAALVARNRHEAAVEARTLCDARLTEARAVFAQRLADSGLTAESFAALKPAIARIDTDRATIDAHRLALQSATDAARHAAAATEGLLPPDLSALEQACADAEAALHNATDARAAAAARLDQLTRMHRDLAETLARLDAAEAATGPLRTLAALFDGANPHKLTLETFAIGAMFDQVLAAANQRLAPMSGGRYRLEREVEGGGRGQRGLGIQVFDLHTGKARGTATLSGGETFIAALSLALGLADVVEGASGRVRLDTVFIDEGFGSLDTDGGAGTLDQVLQVLAGLVSRNRAVGLISHVPLVQEAIPNGFTIRKDLTGSRVEERTGP